MDESRCPATILHGRRGDFLFSETLPGVAIPVRADIPGADIAVHFVDEHSVPLGGKGIGEAGATGGAAAAVADAVVAATGRRVRSWPILPGALVRA